MNSRLFVLSLVGCLSLSAPGEAGDRELYVLFVDMTPDALSDDASSKCVKQIRRNMRDDTEITRMGETRLRKLANQLDRSVPFTEWPASSFAKPKEGKKTYFDAVVLVDCRPAAQHVDFSVSPASGGVVHSQWRGRAVTRRVTKWIGSSILQRAWRGFVP